MYSEAVDYFYEKCLHVYRGFADAPGYQLPARRARDVACAQPRRQAATATG